MLVGGAGSADPTVGLGAPGKGEGVMANCMVLGSRVGCDSQGEGAVYGRQAGRCPAPCPHQNLCSTLRATTWGRVEGDLPG